LAMKLRFTVCYGVSEEPAKQQITISRKELRAQVMDHVDEPARLAAGGVRQRDRFEA